MNLNIFNVYIPVSSVASYISNSAAIVLLSEFLNRLYIQTLLALVLSIRFRNYEIAIVTAGYVDCKRL